MTSAHVRNRFSPHDGFEGKGTGESWPSSTAEDALKTQDMRNSISALLSLPGASGNPAKAVVSPGSSGMYPQQEAGATRWRQQNLEEASLSCALPAEVRHTDVVEQQPCNVDSVRAEFTRLLEDERETRSEAVREVRAICAALTLSFEGRVQELTRAVYQDVEPESQAHGMQQVQASGSAIYQQAESLVSAIRRRLGDRCWDQLTALRIDIARLDADMARQRALQRECVAPSLTHSSTRCLHEMAEEQKQMPEMSGLECSNDLASQLRTELAMHFGALETGLRASIADLESHCWQTVELRIGALGRDLCRELDTRLEGLETLMPMRVSVIENAVRATEAGLAGLKVDVKRRVRELQQCAAARNWQQSPRQDATDHRTSVHAAEGPLRTSERPELAVPEIDLSRARHAHDGIAEWVTSKGPESFNISSEVTLATDVNLGMIEHIANHAALDADASRSCLSQLPLVDSDRVRFGHFSQHPASIDQLQGTLVGRVSSDMGLQTSSGLHGSYSIPGGLPLSPHPATRGKSFSAVIVPPSSPSRQRLVQNSTQSPGMGGGQDSSQLPLQPRVLRQSSAYSGSPAYNGPVRIRSDTSPRSTMPQVRVMVRSPSHTLQAASHGNRETPAVLSGTPPVHQGRLSSCAQLGGALLPGQGSPQLVASRCASRTPQNQQTLHAASTVAARSPTLANCVQGDSAAPISPMAMRTGSRSAVHLGFGRA